MHKQILFLVLIAVYLAIISCSTDNKMEDFSFVPTPTKVGEMEIVTLPIGSPMPEFRLPGTDERYWSDKDFEDSEVLVIVFTCNHCPTAQAYETRIKAIQAVYQEQGVQVVAISPNSPLALLPEECGYTDLGDTYAEMQIRARDHEFNFPYLYDGDDHRVSVQFGPVSTPHVFVFDADRVLRYRGRLDGQEKPGNGNAEDLRNALEAVLSGQEIIVPDTKAFGCSVKWSWKDDWTRRVNQKWAAKPVTLEPIDTAGVRQLMGNPTDKLRLINFWATWCGPCIIEYPEFIEIYRMYSGRDFEFISISTDEPEKHEKALKFLQSKESAVKNYIFEGEEVYQLIYDERIGWDGSLPHTVLLEPGGKVVYRVNAAIDPLELKRTIVNHPMMGRYY